MTYFMCILQSIGLIKTMVLNGMYLFPEFIAVFVEWLIRVLTSSALLDFCKPGLSADWRQRDRTDK